MRDNEGVSDGLTYKRIGANKMKKKDRNIDTNGWCDTDEETMCNVRFDGSRNKTKKRSARRSCAGYQCVVFSRDHGILSFPSGAAAARDPRIYNDKTPGTNKRRYFSSPCLVDKTPDGKFWYARITTDG